MKRFVLLIFIILTSFSFADEVLKINRDHSFIKFKIPYMAISEVEGQFRRFEGKLIKDDKGRVKSIEVTIDSSSIDTNNKLRDAHLKESSFLNSDKYSEIKVNYQDESYRLLIKDKDIKSKGSLPELVVKTDTWGKVSYFQKVVKKLPLKGFNFKWNKALPGGEMLLGDEVEVTAVFQWQDPSQMTAASKHRIPDTKALRKIRFEGDRYQGMEPEMVQKRVQKAQAVITVKDSDESEFKLTETISMYLMFFLGLIGLIGFYLFSRFAVMNKEKSGTVLDIVFICAIGVYLLSSWHFMI